MQGWLKNTRISTVVPLTPLLPLSARKQGEKVWLWARRRALLGAEVSSIPAHVTLQVIQPLELFRGLEHEALTAIAHAARWRSVTRATFLFFQGDPATAFYILHQGRVRLTQVTAEGHQVLVRFIAPGEGMGIVAALGGMVYPASAEALDDCQALVWDGRTITRLMERHPRLALNGMRLLAQRVREFQDRLRELATERVERRIARALLRLAHQTGRKVPGGILIDLPLSRQSLAEMTGTTLYTVSRTLTQWGQRGLLDARRERVIIREPHALVVIAEDLPNDTTGS